MATSPSDRRRSTSFSPSTTCTVLSGSASSSGRQYRDKFRESVIRPALRPAGLPESIRTYDLCHSHASLLIDLGANVLAVSQRMGHGDPSVTLREYGHLIKGALQRLTDDLDGLRESTATTPAEVAILDLAGHRIGHTGHEKDTESG